MGAKICHQLLGAFLTILVLQPLVVKSRPVKRCPGDNGGPTSGGLFHLDVNMNNSLSSERWYKFPVTYGFRSVNVVPQGLDPKAVSANFDVAFGKWKAAIPDPQFAFQRISPGDNANIKIVFTSLPAEFNSYGNTTPEGSVYLDNTHTLWSSKPSPAGNEVDLLSSILNAIGHTLGLGDCTDPTAVMYAILKPGSIKRNLSPDDISRIQNLYLYSLPQPHLELAKPI